MKPITVYLILRFAASFLFSLIFTVDMLYQVTFVGLTPLQLVLVGTILETTVFLFEIPTGVVADVKSRRLSVIVGYVIIGLGFIVEGSFPLFATVALAQVLWGFGYTLTSGATEAFLRGSQAAWVGALMAIPLSVALGIVVIRLPIILGGAAMLLLALFLALTMTEEGFSPTPRQERATWKAMLETVQDAGQMARRQPVLYVLLAIGLFYGLYSEGFDRLWTPHLLEDYGGSFVASVNPVVWFGAIEAVTIVASLAATEVARRRVDTQHSLPIAWALIASATATVAGLLVFALTRSFWLALGCYWLVGMMRSLVEPLQTAWLNLRIDNPSVRATLFSVSGQVDALGQIAGGPAVGAIGNVSIRAALAASALMLSPVLPLYGLAIGRGRGDSEVRRQPKQATPYPE